MVTGIPDSELYTQRSYWAPVDIPSLCLKPMQYLPENQKNNNIGPQMNKKYWWQGFNDVEIKSLQKYVAV